MRIAGRPAREENLTLREMGIDEGQLLEICLKSKGNQKRLSKMNSNIDYSSSSTTNNDEKALEENKESN